MLWGTPALRLKGLYLAFVTLMLAGTFQTIISAVGFHDGGTVFFGRADAIQRVMMARPPFAISDTNFLIYCAVWATAAFVVLK
jgi:branched-chain amino acid transport system permease protein